MAELIIGIAIGIILLFIGVSILKDLKNTYHISRPVAKKAIIKDEVTGKKTKNRQVLAHSDAE